MWAVRCVWGVGLGHRVWVRCAWVALPRHWPAGTSCADLRVWPRVHPGGIPSPRPQDRDVMRVPGSVRVYKSITADFRSMSSAYAAPMTKQIVILGRCGPEADAEALKAVVRMVAETQPDEVVLFERSTRLVELLREVYDGRIGAHDDHPEPHFGVVGLTDVYDIAPGWISMSRSNGYAASSIAGNTAQNAAKKFGASAVCAHTLRAGVGSYTFGFGGEIAKTVTGMEVGHLIVRKLARPVGGQLGYGRLIIEGQHVEPEVVPILVWE
jgi:hypothetical protein